MISGVPWKLPEASNHRCCSFVRHVILRSLWAKNGEEQKAADLLAPIYSSFTEGSGIADCIEAKTILERL